MKTKSKNKEKKRHRIVIESHVHPTYRVIYLSDYTNMSTFVCLPVCNLNDKTPRWVSTLKKTVKLISFVSVRSHRMALFTDMHP